MNGHVHQYQLIIDMYIYRHTNNQLILVLQLGTPFLPSKYKQPGNCHNINIC